LVEAETDNQFAIYDLSVSDNQQLIFLFFNTSQIVNEVPDIK
jgi:hypothetical protein